VLLIILVLTLNRRIALRDGEISPTSLATKGKCERYWRCRQLCGVAQLDLDQLRLAADQIEQSALAKKGKDWAEQFIQDRYLFSVRLRMICGDWVAARKALNIKRKFDAVLGQHQVLLELLDTILATKDLGELPAQRGFQRFEEYFAAVRGAEGDLRIKEDSGWVDCGYRFELSMVRHRIFSASSSFPDWSDVFRAISAESS